MYPRTALMTMIAADRRREAACALRARAARRSPPPPAPRLAPVRWALLARWTWR